MYQLIESVCLNESFARLNAYYFRPHLIMRYDTFRSLRTFTAHFMMNIHRQNNEQT